MEQELETLIEFCQRFPEWLLCLIMVGMAILQYIFPPVPSDTLLVALGVLVSNRAVGPFASFFSYCVGAVVGAYGLFELCWFLRDKAKRLTLLRSQIDEEKIEQARTRLRKYGGISYFFLRFVPSMQCITIITMGLARLERRRAYFFIGTVTVFACTAYYLLGVFLGQNIGVIIKAMTAMGAIGWVLLGAIVAAAVTAVIIYKIKKKK